MRKVLASIAAASVMVLTTWRDPADAARRPADVSASSRSAGCSTTCRPTSGRHAIDDADDEHAAALVVQLDSPRSVLSAETLRRSRRTRSQHAATPIGDLGRAGTRRHASAATTWRAAAAPTSWASRPARASPSTHDHRRSHAALADAWRLHRRSRRSRRHFDPDQRYPNEDGDAAPRTVGRRALRQAHAHGPHDSRRDDRPARRTPC